MKKEILKLFTQFNWVPVNVNQTNQETLNIKGITENVTLPLKDREFLENLKQLFKINYKKPNYHRMHLANDMAISEKQLQRKLKTLINKNPMEYLKEYRLQKAIEKLKDGYRISVTCFDCGFTDCASILMTIKKGINNAEFR
jgi:AraC-like DNA-binding protein